MGKWIDDWFTQMAPNITCMDGYLCDGEWYPYRIVPWISVSDW